MAATFVNKAGVQHFFSTGPGVGTTVSFLDTPAIAVTAGNFLSVVFRAGSGVDPANITVTDTAGNTYVLDGQVSAAAPNSRLFAYSCRNCLGHPANVVHCAWTPARAFVALNVSQYSGMPVDIGVDVVSVSQPAGGTTATVTPSSAYTDQLVIVAADLTSSGHSNISPAVFTLLYQSTYDGGTPVGIGSHDVWYSINSTRQFNGTQPITCTYFGGFETVSKSMLAVIYRQAPSSGVPVTTPLAAQTPCTPQATVGNGGKGKAGCNVGGIGGGHEYTGPFGSVPQHDDPDDGEILTGEPGEDLDAWIELVHTDYPSGDQTTYRRSFEELADDDVYEGGRKESGVLSIGQVEHALGNEQGGFEAASTDIELSDERDRLFRDLAADQDLDGDEYRIKAATRSARAEHTTPRVLQRGIVQAAALESMLKAKLTGVDWLFSDFGPFGPDRKDPNYTFGDLAGAAPDMTSDTKSQPIALLYGEKSDEGAVDPITLAPASKGLLPGFYLGKFDLGDVLPDAPATTGRTLAEAVALMQTLVDDDADHATWNSTLGFDIGGDDIVTLKALGTVPDTWEALADIIGGGDLNAVLAQGSTPAPSDTIWGFVATGLGPWFRYTGVYGSDLGGGNAQNMHDRTKLDPVTRSDIMVPGINWPFAAPYFELTNPDTGRVFWLTGVFVRGPLLDDHLNGVVTLAFNAIGIEDVGDGSGLPIAHVEAAKQHRLENHWLNLWSSGPYATPVTFPQFADGVPKVRSSSFTTRQNFFQAQLGGEGLTVSWYSDKQQSTLDIVRQWNAETDSRIGVNQHGQIIDWGFDETEDTSAWPKLNHVADIYGPITRTSGEERENVVSGSCDWDPDFEKFRVGPITFSSTTGIQKYKGRTKQGDAINSEVLDDQTQFGWVLQRRLVRLQFGVTLLELKVPIKPWINYDVGRGLLLTSEDGPGPNGYVDHEHIIMRRQIDLASELLTLTLWDVKALRELLTGDTSPIVDPIYASVGGAVVFATDSHETVYASR